MTLCFVIARRHDVAICLFLSSYPWHYFGHTSFVMTMGYVIEKRHDVAICLFLSFNSWDYFGHTSLVMTVGCVIARRHDLAICLFLVSFMRLPRHSFLFPRNDSGLRHCEEARRGNLFVFSFHLWDYFSHTSLVMTVGYVIARRHGAAIYLFLVLIHEITSVILPS